MSDEVKNPNIEIYTAFIKAQAEFEPVVFDKVNPHFKSKYASLAAIRKATEVALTKYGLTLIQPWDSRETGDIVIHTLIIHTSGAKISSSCLVQRAGKSDQQFGSSITYSRRYQASSLLGIAGEEDDDAEIDRKAIEEKEATKNLVSFIKIKETKAKEIKALLNKAVEIDPRIVGEFWVAAKCCCFEEIKESDYDTIIRSLTSRINIEANKGVK